ncbi:hypothetical protein [Hyperthermus butylicus]|uniref:Uncharacterized protein n=1 Tax=Hyperthermus butylicus (strain DSM 5456 / JCM 9403 / PLM1-5) TaxID=415426 RepID=A2BLW7_HYPBU|nr:hypothetical protein [Hyperthermus butylicus]ABM80978.1 hypothetical protein Hbut_1141 [Hyperthermus butylicus DSM 5456]
MAKIYVLKEPRKDRAWNIYMLREAARLKKWFDGIYYSSKLKRLLAVFRPTPGTHVNLLVFEEMGESVLRDTYRMECPRGCNRCCVFRSGAFMIENEVRQLPPELRERVLRQPSEIIRTPGGPVRIYRLDTEAMGRCIFFDVERGECIIERYGKHLKPIVCLLTYCTVFATRNGKLYLKTGYRSLPDGRVEMFYREVSDKEWNRMIARMGEVWRRYRRVYLSKIREEEETARYASQQPR